MTIHTTTRFASVLTILSLSIVPACNSNDSDDDSVTAETAADTSSNGQTEASLYATAFDGALSSAIPTTPDQAAAALAARLTAALSPAACATVSQAGATVNVALTDCTGPRGLADVSGQLAITVASVTASSISFTAHGEHMGAEGGSFATDATATYAYHAGTQSIEVSATSSGVGPFGRTLEHTGDYTVTWDGSCATVDGTWSSTGASRGRTTDVHLTRCSAGCPTGEASVANARNTLSLMFDGTATATWTAGARTGSLALSCTP